MKTTAQAVATIVGGRIVQGEQVAVFYGAYRLKQVKRKHTVLFTKQHLVNWDALLAYAPVVIVTQWRYRVREVPHGVTIIEVENADEAMWRFVTTYRSRLHLPVIAVTGTAGKTTTTEMIRHMLSKHKRTVATQLSTNSRTAHLDYLLRIEADTEAAVFETAVGAPGDLIRAGRFFQPTIGVITNIGAHHLDHCKTPEAYIAAKGEMLQIVQPSGTMILNADDAQSRLLNRAVFTGKYVMIGLGSGHDVGAQNVQYTAHGMQFTLLLQGKHYQVSVPGYGEHQVYNALAAIAAVLETGLTVEQAVEGLKTFQPLGKQLQLVRGVNGSMLLDDTWSITTTSLQAALQTMAALANGKKQMAIIGTITDVGQWGRVIHEQAAELVCKSEVQTLITIGKHAKIIAEHAKKCGFKGRAWSFNNHVLAHHVIRWLADEQTLLLIKGDMYSETMFELARRLKG